jgi:FlaA1/EpsC-like NDP-sugar epimerase
MLVRELERSPDWRVVALVDDDPTKQGLELFGRPVAGTVADLPRVLRDCEAQHVILAMPSASPETLRRATDFAVEAGGHVFTVPRLEDLMTGRVTISAMRPVAIEDLLGREPVDIDTAHVQAMITGKTVLITGAGGSIGSELCRQLARFAPARIVLFELGEFALYTIEQWFLVQPSRDADRAVGRRCKGHRAPGGGVRRMEAELIFHAAAYKHVPLMEVGNAWQAVRNNVLGTLQLAEHAQRHSAERFVLISTDKAVNPTNVMGATKRLAEMACEALYRLRPKAPSSDGALRQRARQHRQRDPQVRRADRPGWAGDGDPPRDQPLLHVHPRGGATRAAGRLDGLTAGEVFVLDMGAPVKIVDLARNMIRLSGYTEDEIRIEFSGLRPGEKLYEELLADAEETRETPHPKLRIAQSRAVDEGFMARLRPWLANPGPVTDEEVRRQLGEWVPEYRPALHSISPPEQK